jgi:hypothetical protein
VGFDVLTTCQPSTVWCSRERLPAVAAQPAKVRQSCSATDYLFTQSCSRIKLHVCLHAKCQLLLFDHYWNWNMVTDVGKT